LSYKQIKPRHYKIQFDLHILTHTAFLIGLLG